ncbi:MAG: ATP-binding cassette domain-containing protein [Pseudomonadota bacterium]
MMEIRLKKRQGNFTLDIDLALPFSGICGLIGASGSGKSSLFALLAGHTTPDDGYIILGGRPVYLSHAGLNVPSNRRGIGLVFQEGLLFPHMKVRGNLLYGAKPYDGRTFGDVVDALGISHLLDRYPSKLSGGERQRVAIGRALLAKPDLLLLDEPVSALDQGLRHEVLGLLEDIHTRTGLPMIYISHAPEEIRRLATHVVTLKDGAVADMSRHPAPHTPDQVARNRAMLRAI